MNDITIEHRVSPAKLDVLAVEVWPLWEKEVSTFEWTYDQKETCYIVKGEATVTPRDGGQPVALKRGDLVIFSKGLACTWEIHKPVKKHYLLED